MRSYALYEVNQEMLNFGGCSVLSFAVVYLLFYSLFSLFLLTANWYETPFNIGKLLIIFLSLVMISGIPPSPLFFIKIIILGYSYNTLGPLFIVLTLVPVVFFWIFSLEFMLNRAYVNPPKRKTVILVRGQGRFFFMCLFSIFLAALPVFLF